MPDEDAHILDRAKLEDESPHVSLFPALSSTANHGTETNKSTEATRLNRAVASIKKAFHTKDDDSGDYQQEYAHILAPAPETGNQEARLAVPVETHEKKTLKDVLHKPVAAIQSIVQSEGGAQISARLIAKEVSHGHDVKLVQAQDDTDLAVTNSEKIRAKEKLDGLVDTRQAMFIRWTMDRHVQCVRRVTAVAEPALSRADFTSTDRNGKNKTDWSQYSRYVSDTLWLPMFNFDTLECFSDIPF
jgi:hypothetical protein